MEEIAYRLVNWVEGMSVNPAHFRQQENYFIEHLRRARADRMTGCNYGLLPPAGHEKVSSSFEISEQVTGRVTINLKRCNAVTAGGCRIAYNPEGTNYLSYTHVFSVDEGARKGTTKLWDVILSIDPFKRIATGMPDADELPPRHPDVREHYALSIVPQGDLKYEELGMFHLVIGRVRENGGTFQVDSDYIPPCTAMAAHPDLVEYLDHFMRQLNKIEQNSARIIAKVHEKNNGSFLAENIEGMCRSILDYFAFNSCRFRNTALHASPLETVSYCSALAHVCFNSLRTIVATHKEELLHYFYEWSDITPGSLEELIANTVEIEYEHNSLRAMMLQLDSFVRVLSELWTKLCSLEYIGQHKESIIISERMR